MEREESVSPNLFVDHLTTNCSGYEYLYLVFSVLINAVKMKLTLLVIMLTTFVAVRSIPVDNVQDENYISTKDAKESEGSDLKPAEFFYPGLGLGFGFGHPALAFYSKPYWHPLHVYKVHKPFYTGYYTGLGHASHWNYRY